MSDLASSQITGKFLSFQYFINILSIVGFMMMIGYFILDAEKETVRVIGSSSSEVAYSELRCNEKIQEKEEDCQFGQEAQGSSQKTTCLTEPTDSIDREMPDLTPTASDLSEVTGNLLSVFFSFSIS